MDHPWYAQDLFSSWLRVVLLPLRFAVALAGMVAVVPLLFNLPGLTAPMEMASIAIAAASLAVHGLGFLAFRWDHHESVDAFALHRHRRRNRRALNGLD